MIYLISQQPKPPAKLSLKSLPCAGARLGYELLGRKGVLSPPKVQDHAIKGMLDTLPDEASISVEHKSKATADIVEVARS